MQATLYTLAKFKVKDDSLPEVIGILTALTRETRREPGCIEYGYFQDLEDSSQFTSFEAWESEEAEARHWASAHLKSALSNIENLLVESPIVNKYRKTC
ncbi:putative quinol monooxygenase [Pseudomonas sp. Teo4]|uniref:putative quinol monooxygenase n=1 Tax=Pseudomonas sp. Teo4 TaxID=3064528 RepID=UPI002ABB5170|nr:antibiotic biosynthesis monooxygenase [Pseudomonas sp. Teo4]MDZ3992743.1 hypothetical protein [Pseudomonas sp. Teo4]